MNQNSQNTTQPRTSWLSLLVILGFTGILGISPTSRTSVCACGGPASQGKVYVGSLNRAQQSYWLEHQRFTHSIEALGIGIRPETNYYRYSIIDDSTINDSTKVISYGIPLEPGYSYTKEVYFFGLYSRKVADKQLPTYVGAVFAVQPETTIAILCRADKPGIEPPAPPELQAGRAVCAEGTTVVH